MIRISRLLPMARPRRDRIKLPVHVHCTVARGREYFSYHPFRGTRRAGKRIKLPGAPANADGTPNDTWWSAYRLAAGEIASAPRAGTFAALIDAYRASPEWAQLSERTQNEKARHLERIASTWGELQVSGVDPKHVLSLRDTRARTPADANNLLRTLSALLGWSSLRGWRGDNPCHRVPKLKGGDGWDPWPWEDLDYLRQHARPAMWEAAALALYTGQRLSDILLMRWSDFQNGHIAVTQNKTRKKLWIPVHRELGHLLQTLQQRTQEALADPIVDLTTLRLPILRSSRGSPWTVDGFKASWSAELNRSVFSRLRDRRLVFHGLRKSAVVFLLEAGCTDAETAAITGQTRDMVEHYARQVNQRRLAATAILKWEAADQSRNAPAV